MNGVILCDATPKVTERAGLFIIETASGGETIAVALTQRDLSILAHRASQAVALVTLQRQAAVIPFPTPKPPRKRSKASAPARGKGR